MEKVEKTVMAMTDPIADMLTRTQKCQHSYAKVANPSVQDVKKPIAEILKNEGFIKDFSVAQTTHRELSPELKYGPNKEDTHGSRKSRSQSQSLC